MSHVTFLIKKMKLQKKLSTKDTRTCLESSSIIVIPLQSLHKRDSVLSSVGFIFETVPCSNIKYTKIYQIQDNIRTNERNNCKIQKCHC